MLNFMIVVEDAGELKTVSRADLPPGSADTLAELLDAVLDARAIAAGEYDPSENDEPFIVTVGEQANV